MAQSAAARGSPPLVHKWEAKLGIEVAGYFLQRMKTKWGGCHRRAGHIRLNTELVKKPKDLLEYVVVHEVLHLIEPTHSEHFMALQSKHYPTWREARAELNALPLSAEVWRMTGVSQRGDVSPKNADRLALQYGGAVGVPRTERMEPRQCSKFSEKQVAYALRQAESALLHEAPRG